MRLRMGTGGGMFQSFFQAVCRMGIFLVCVRAVLHFGPKECYEKYLKLLAGVLILIQLFLPLGKFLLGRSGQEAEEALRQFRRELEAGMETAAERAEAADALLERMTLEEVRRRLEPAEEPEESVSEGNIREGSIWIEEIEPIGKK